MQKSNSETWVLDDGISEITPVYIITYTQGEYSCFVRANFWCWESIKSIKFPRVGAIKVNGFDLDIESVPGGISYSARVPLSNGRFVFRLDRANNKSIEHIFELPPLDIIELPKIYRPHEPVRVSINNGRQVLDTDIFNMNIKLHQRQLSLKGRVGIDHVDFFSINRVPLQKGIFEANVYRQQRISLKDISDEIKTGWAVASNSRNFTIEVV